MKALALINESSGGVAGIGAEMIDQTIREATSAAGWSADVIKGDCMALIEAAAKATNLDAVLVAGGDGTQAGVAGAIMGRDIAQLPLPCGTVNLFCRDLGIPLTIEEALDAGMKSAPRQIDIGLIGERAFVNNIVFGAYAELAEAREDLRRAENFDDASFALTKVADTLFHSEAARYVVDLDGEKQTFRSNTLIVSNNPFTGSVDFIPRRAALDRGLLAVYLAKAEGGADFAARLIEFITGEADHSENVAQYDCERCVISSRRGEEIRYSVDGDPLESDKPLVLEIRRKALKALAPALTAI